MTPFAKDDSTREELPAVKNRMASLDGREIAAIFAGGTVGAMVRVWLGRHFGGGPPGWPWVTFTINVTGSFALAYLATRLQERLPQSTYRRPLLATGFCGAYTTFSTLQIEILQIVLAHRYALAIGYGCASVCAGFAAVWLATSLVRRARVLA